MSVVGISEEMHLRSWADEREFSYYVPALQSSEPPELKGFARRLPEHLRLQRWRHPEREAAADGDSAENQPDASADHRSDDARHGGAEGDAHAELAPALGDVIGDEAIEADRGEHQSERAEGGEHRGPKLPGLEVGLDEPRHGDDTNVGRTWYFSLHATP